MELRPISGPDLEKLKCKCGQYINKPPIYTKNKENVCANCVDPNDTSPNRAVRNTDWERAANYFTFPCQNKVRGCSDYIKFENVAKHEVTCVYRLISCMFGLHSSCKWEGAANDACKHYQSQHSEFLSRGNEMTNGTLKKIEDEELEKLRCTCGEIVNKPPLYFDQDKVVCMECLQKQTVRTTAPTRNTLYEAIAKYLDFPCRYRQQGCIEYHAFTVVEKHEISCVYRIYVCPLSLQCYCSWKGELSDLYQHCERQHPNWCLESSNVEISFDRCYTKQFMINCGEIPFSFCIQCNLETDQLLLDLVCCVALADPKRITYNLALKNNLTKLSINLENAHPLSYFWMEMEHPGLMHTKVSYIKSVLQATSNVDCSWIINIPEELQEVRLHQEEISKQIKYEEVKERTRCTNCRIYTVPPITRCDNGHIVCVECRGYTNQCERCKKDQVKFTPMPDLEEIARYGNFQCKWWPHCNVTLPCRNIRLHERLCEFRIYDCPICTVWFGNQLSLIQHLFIIHKVFFVPPSQTFLRHQNRTYFYFVAGEIFKFCVANTTVFYYGSLRFINNWKIKMVNNEGASYKFLKRKGYKFSPHNKNVTFDKGQYHISIKFKPN